MKLHGEKMEATKIEPGFDAAADIRVHLLQKLRSVDDILNDETSEVSVELDQTRVGRVSRIDMLQQQRMDQSVRERAMRERARLEAAVRRLDEGTYGLCCKCDDAIAQVRLAADPAAPFCAACQQEFDDRRREGRSLIT